jgi:hypothetical protein
MAIAATILIHGDMITKKYDLITGILSMAAAVAVITSVYGDMITSSF